MSRKKIQMNCQKCGKFRLEAARNLCHHCFREETAVWVICLDCGENKQHYGNGLCKTCHARKRRKDNPEYFKEFDKKRWHAKDKETKYASGRKQYLKNPDIYTHYNHRRSARLKGLAYDLTYEQWLTILKESNNTCYYCGVTNVKLQREHKIPECRGGGYTYSNIVAACQSCNSHKGEKTDEEFIQTKTA